LEALRVKYQDTDLQRSAMRQKLKGAERTNGELVTENEELGCRVEAAEGDCNIFLGIADISLADFERQGIKVEEIMLKCDLSDGKSLDWPHITQVGRAPKLVTSFEVLGRRMLNLLRRSEHCTLDSNRVMDIWYGRQHLQLHERDQLGVVFATFKRIVVLDQQ
jgi:hypothetical protein